MLKIGEPDPQIIDRATKIFHQEANVLNRYLADREYLVDNG
jgi:glutathione S-transferase